MQFNIFSVFNKALHMLIAVRFTANIVIKYTYPLSKIIVLIIHFFGRFISEVFTENKTFT